MTEKGQNTIDPGITLLHCYIAHEYCLDNNNNNNVYFPQKQQYMILMVFLFC